MKKVVFCITLIIVATVTSYQCIESSAPAATPVGASKQTWDTLIAAINKGDLGTVKAIVPSQIKRNATTQGGRSLLSMAQFNKQQAIVDYLNGSDAITSITFDAKTWKHKKPFSDFWQLRYDTADSKDIDFLVNQLPAPFKKSIEDVLEKILMGFDDGEKKDIKRQYVFEKLKRILRDQATVSLADFLKDIVVLKPCSHAARKDALNSGRYSHMTAMGKLLCNPGYLIGD